MEFWTPSVQTKDYLHQHDGKVDDVEKWQVVTGDDVLARFGTVLHSNINVFGYRRTEVWGQGRTAYKPGWWWTMSVTTNYSVSDLVRTYREFWKVQQNIRVEVIDNHGSDGQ